MPGHRVFTHTRLARSPCQDAGTACIRLTIAISASVKAITLGFSQHMLGNRSTFKLHRQQASLCKL